MINSSGQRDDVEVTTRSNTSSPFEDVEIGTLDTIYCLARRRNDTATMNSLTEELNRRGIDWRTRWVYVGDDGLSPCRKILGRIHELM